MGDTITNLVEDDEEGDNEDEENMKGGKMGE